LPLFQLEEALKEFPKRISRNWLVKPLIEWTLDAVDKTRMVDEVVVSTDDKDIEGYCQKVFEKVLRRSDRNIGRLG